jgi:RecA-family ATPase
MQKTFDSIKWILPPYITEGCSLLVGRPKIGKSWLVLQIGMTVSAGGMAFNVQCEQGDVLCCALEDNERRLQSRLKGLKAAGVAMDASRLTLLTEMPRIDAGAIGVLTEWVESVTNPRLIIIDCLAKIRPPIEKRETAYANDYASLEQLRAFANKHKVAIIVVHHDRKMNAEDAFDTVSGTLGLNGAADTVMIIKKESKGGHTLYAQGRDIPSVEHAVEANSTGEVVVWQVLGDATEVRIKEQRKAILEVLTDEPQSPRQIAKAINQKIANVSKTLQRMYADGMVAWCGQGKYHRLRTSTQ